eukprot:scaffold238068_cov29-Prasinocladus_malaysianus.AAC.1
METGALSDVPIAAKIGEVTENAVAAKVFVALGNSAFIISLTDSWIIFGLWYVESQMTLGRKSRRLRPEKTFKLQKDR